MLAQLGCGPELGERTPPHAQQTPDHHHRPTPTPGMPGEDRLARGSRRCGDFPGRGMWGRGPPGTGGQDSPRQEAQRGRSAADARPVSTAPRAGRLSTWGWGGGGRQEEPGRVSGPRLTPPLPLPPLPARLPLPPPHSHPGRSAHTLLSLCGVASLQASTRPQRERDCKLFLLKCSRIFSCPSSRVCF